MEDDNKGLWVEDIEIDKTFQHHPYLNKIVLDGELYIQLFN